MARTSNVTVPFWTRDHFKEQVGKPLEETAKDARTRPEAIFCGRHKAGRLLGPTEITSESGPHGNNSYPPNIRKAQKKVTSKKDALLLEINCEPIEECTTEQNGWRTRGSSPLLGCLGNDYDSVGSKINSCAQPSRSSSMLDSFYDPSSSPLSISQQTSASSALYMALRKGCPRVKSPLCDDIAGSGKSSSDKVVDPLSKNRRGERQRPPHLDLSTLFPKPQTSSGPLCSPNSVMSSPSVMSLASGSIHSTSSSRPKWLRWRSSKSKGSSSYTNITSPQSSIAPVCAPTLSDSGLEPRDMQDWLRNAKSGELSKHRDVSECPKEPLEDGPGSSYLSRSASCSLPPAIRTLTSRMKYGLITGYDTKFDCTVSPYSDNRSCSRKTRKSRRPLRGPGQVAHTDLHTQSFLALSSSEDDNDGDLRSLHKPCRRSPKLNGHRYVCDAIRTGSKTITPPKQSCDVSKYIKARSSSLSYKATKGALEERSKLSDVLHSSRLGQLVRPERNLLEDGSTFDSSRRRADSPSAAESTQEPFIRIPIELQLRTDRFMAVTREEENLLEAMREKRASMRRAEFAEDHNNANEKRDIRCSPRRPKTANANKSSSIFLKANIFSFPTPPRLRSTKVLHHSSDAVSYKELSRFQQLTTVDERPVQEDRKSSKSSPDDSDRIKLNPSETLLSPPISQRSPFTPSPTKPSTVRSPSGDTVLVTFPEPSFYGDKTGHHRRRTVSSEMFFLDKVESET